MSCPKCQPSEAPAGGVATMTGREPTIALVGNPNVGKSTLFNRITGARQRAINAPGTTVQVATGHWRAVGARVLDLPGTYSLIATSPDEQVVTDTVSGAPGSVTDPDAGLGIDLILVILDGSSMTRSLYLLAQVAQTGRPAVAVVTMADVAEQNGEPVNVSALAKRLGIPVMAFDPRSGRDSAVLEQMIATALVTRPRVNGIAPDPNAPGYSADAAAEALANAGLPERGEREDLIGNAGCGCGCGCSDGSGRKSEGQTPGREESAGGAEAAADGRAAAVDERGSATGAGRAGGADGVASGASASASDGPDAASPVASDAGAAVTTVTAAESEMDRAALLFSWVDGVEASCREHPADPARLSRSDKIDRVLLNPVAGVLIFLGLLWALFHAAGEWAKPLQDHFEDFFASEEDGATSVANGITSLLDKAGIGGGWLQALLVKGLAAGLGVVASFFPLMFVIYIAFSILEDSGYMARAAFLGDRLMRRIGLDGRVILPLIMGFGCNLPSLAAARTLPSARQRLVTVLITPYTSCAARLTIYLMVARIFFAGNVGTIVFLMHLFSIIMVVSGAWVLKHFITKDEQSAPLMLVLPAYQVPRLLHMLKMTLRRSWAFVTGAGKIIVVMTIVVWIMGAIPMGAGGEGKKFADKELAMEDSLYGKTAQVLVPVFKPTGFGEWHMTGALMTGFVAKETVVSSIVTSYNLDPDKDAGDAQDDGSDLGKLPKLVTSSLKESAGEGREGLAAFAFMVFVLTYTPCLATVAEQTKLIGGKRATLAVGVQLAVAWALAVAVFQIGKIFV